MKKRTILLILITLLMGVFITGCTTQGPFDRISKGLNALLTNIFGTINESPNVWMRVFLFVAVFAVLYGSITKIKKINDRMDNKTIGILTFVMALATTSLITQEWLAQMFLMFAGVPIGIIFLLPIIGSALLMRWVFTNERESKFYWGLVILAWVGCSVLWTKMPLVRSFIQGYATTELGWVGFIADANIIIISVGIIVSIIMIFQTGLFDWADKVGQRSGAKEAGKEHTSKLPDAGSLIKSIKLKINEALGMVTHATDWLIPTQDAVEMISDIDAVLAPRINAIKEYKTAFKLKPGRAAPKDCTDATTALAAVDTKITEVETALGTVMANQAVSSHKARITALNTANTALTNLRANIAQLDAAIHHLEALL